MSNILKIRISDKILLKQIEYIDAEIIFKTINSQRESLRKWLTFIDTTKKIADTQKYIKSVIDVPDENREYIFVIFYDSVFAGLIGFEGTNKYNKKTEIGYWLSEDYRKKGIVTESVKGLMRFAYKDLEINRIQIKCAVGNIQSSNIPKQLGYKFEGIERAGELLSDGTFTNVEVYSLLKYEFDDLTNKNAM
ncbi:MAG: GNAT family N-acetyltransferase [Bacteroidales bacterium]|nr:GNAT family N-acetyltransferase [Bacteroidales bacterium]